MKEQLWIICLVKKIFSREFMLPLIGMFLVYRMATTGVTVEVIKTVGWIVTVLAIGYGTVGTAQKIIKAINGKK